MSQSHYQSQRWVYQHLWRAGRDPGSAVGLSNIWKFPYLTGENGGAGFLLVLCHRHPAGGIAVMISEIMLGREARTDAVSAGSSSWLRRATLVADRRHGGERGLPHHVVLLRGGGLVFAHIFKAASGGILSTDPAVTGLPSIRSSRIPCRVCSGSGWCCPLMGDLC